MDLLSIKNKKIIIAGGSGFIGRSLCAYFSPHCREIVILSRDAKIHGGKLRTANWDGKNIGPWMHELVDSDVLINLAGKSIHCLFNAANKFEILQSRVLSVEALDKAIRHTGATHLVWIQFTGAGIYSHESVAPHGEDSRAFGDGFIAEVGKKWEGAFAEVHLPATQKIIFRLSLALGREGGVFPILRRLGQWGLAGRQGSGKQKVSWIHVKDIAAIVDFVLQNKFSGIFNLAAPQILSNAGFMKELRAMSLVPFGLAAPEILLKFSRHFTGVEPELLLNDLHVLPKRLTDAGYVFYFSNIHDALSDLFAH